MRRLGGVVGRHGGVFAASLFGFGGVLGALWAVLGLALGCLWSHLGGVWGVLEGVLGPSWLRMGFVSDRFVRAGRASSLLDQSQFPLTPP